jgi:hypothetical protein
MEVAVSVCHLLLGHSIQGSPVDLLQRVEGILVAADGEVKRLRIELLKMIYGDRRELRVRMMTVMKKVTLRLSYSCLRPMTHDHHEDLFGLGQQ